MEPREQGRPAALQGHPPPQRRPPGRGGRRQAARHDALDQGKGPGGQKPELGARRSPLAVEARRLSWRAHCLASNSQVASATSLSDQEELCGSCTLACDSAKFAYCSAPRAIGSGNAMAGSGAISWKRSTSWLQYRTLLSGGPRETSPESARRKPRRARADGGGSDASSTASCASISIRTCSTGGRSGPTDSFVRF